jgi:hypothetical protein
VDVRFEWTDLPAPWGDRQPKFERLESEGPDRFFLVGSLASGQQIRVQLAKASYRQDTAE